MGAAPAVSSEDLHQPENSDNGREKLRKANKRGIRGEAGAEKAEGAERAEGEDGAEGGDGAGGYPSRGG